MGTDWPTYIESGGPARSTAERMTQFVGHLFFSGYDATEVARTAKAVNRGLSQPMPRRDVQRLVEQIRSRRDPSA